MNEMNENFDEFDKYVMDFDFNEDMIAYKYNHSYRVLHQCDEISYTLNLDEEDNYLTCLIGLLHDFGRFEQWTKYKSFDDLKTIDHGDLGEELLFKKGLIKNFKLDDEFYDIVSKAIKYHNKYELPDDLTVREKMHAKIVRDADKLDIIYVFSTTRLIELKEDDSEISEEVKKEFYLHEPVKRVNCKTVNDRIIFLLSFAFDLYYNYSRGLILDKGYYDKILEHIKDKEKFKPYFDEVEHYLKESEIDA